MRLRKLISGWMAGFALLAPAGATTLVKLSVDEMVAQSTGIVRGRVSGCQAAQRGASIFTECVVRVSETLKGQAASTLNIAIPGGAMRAADGRRVRQVIVGAPALDNSREYLLFLWTGRTGVTQLIGLSQGALEIQTSGGQIVALRAPIAAAGFQNSKGEEVTDDGVSITLDAIRRKVAALGAAGASAR